jgi:Protein of unknown function (DUF1569)
MDARRTLKFSNLAEVMPEVDRLLEGHTTVGKWSLGQICNHLTKSLVGSVEGINVKAPWLVRKTLGVVAKRRILRTGAMRAGVKLPERFLPRPGLDARAEAEALRGALGLYSTHTGPMADHPFFGPMSRDEWTRIHCIHHAHHLSFARPGA